MLVPSSAPPCHPPSISPWTMPNSEIVSAPPQYVLHAVSGLPLPRRTEISAARAGAAAGPRRPATTSQGAKRRASERFPRDGVFTKFIVAPARGSGAGLGCGVEDTLEHETFLPAPHAFPRCDGTHLSKSLSRPNL